MEKMIELKCDGCGDDFSKPLKEYKRSVALGRRQYCSRNCAGKNSCSHLSLYTNEVPTYTGDEYTGLRDFVRRAKTRAVKKNFDVDIDKEYLLELWENQSHKCAYTNINLVLPKYVGRNNLTITASLDRIDSSLGYIKGNVQFVSTAINYMKASMTDQETKDFIELITNRE